MISLDLLLEEINMIEKLTNISGRIFIDAKAHVITSDDITQEEVSDLAQRIGSTSARSREGIGTATANKVLRAESRIQAKDIPELQRYLADTSTMVNDILNSGEIVLVEGTQGHELSLDHGSFPYVTSRDTTVMAIAAASGIPIHEFDCDVVGVTRTYPIRVAGNSGPFGADSEELSWAEVSERSGSKQGFEERTTVTGLPRRVSTFSWEQFAKSCKINRPTEIALTFADYLDWTIRGKDYISRSVEEFITQVEKVAECDVTIVQTGPESTIDMDSYRSSILRRIR
jgi:adenylosuccinate synthase